MVYQWDGPELSGALNALTCSGGTVLVVGVASIGGGVFGVQSSGGTINGLTVAQNPPLRTVTITLCQSIDGTPFPFTLNVFGVVTQSYIKRLVVQRTDGTQTVLLTTDATFSNPSGTNSQWAWTGASALWTSAGTRTVEVYF